MAVHTLVIDVVHDTAYQMNAQSSDGTVLGPQGDIDLSLGRRIEGDARVADDEEAASGSHRTFRVVPSSSGGTGSSLRGAFPVPGSLLRSAHQSTAAAKKSMTPNTER